MNRVRRAAVPPFLAAVVASVIVSSVAAADDARPTAGDRDVGLHVVDQRFGIGDDDPFTATIELTGTAAELADVSDAVHGTAGSAASTDAAAGGATVRVRAHEAVTETAQLAVLDAGGAGPVVDTVDVPAADVFVDGDALTGTVTAVVESGDADGLDLPAFGIYPITIEVVVGGEVVAGTMTFVERFDPDATTDSAPLAVSIMAGVADPGPWPSSMELSSASIEVAKLIELAEAVDGPLSISLPPSLVTALAAADDTTPTEPAETSTPDTTESSEHDGARRHPRQHRARVHGARIRRRVPRRVPCRRAHRPAGDRARPVVDRSRGPQRGVHGAAAHRRGRPREGEPTSGGQPGRVVLARDRERVGDGRAPQSRHPHARGARQHGQRARRVDGFGRVRPVRRQSGR